MKSWVILAAVASTMAMAVPEEPLICNAAAIARGDCTATAAIVPSETATQPLICNAAAIARGDCTATAASVPSETPAVVVAGADRFQPAMIFMGLGALLLI
ncbi:hypothetical protein ACHAP7_010598 [Fusarium lateritium]